MKNFLRRIKEKLIRNKEYELAFRSFEHRLSLLEEDNHEHRFSVLERNNNELLRYHYLHEMRQIGGRMDFYLIALMIQNYYSNRERYNALDTSGKKMVDYIFSDEFYRDNISSRVFPLDSKIKTFICKSLSYNFPHMGYPQINSVDYLAGCEQDDEGTYALLNGLKVFLMNNKEAAQNYWRGLMVEQLPDHPHCYLEENGSFNIQHGDIVVDVGGAEGFFCIQHLDKIKHAYIFEAADSWFELLQKTYAPHKDKVTLVKGFVGDGEENISLDDYFKDKEKPTFFKMDVEGAEGSVLRSMSGLLKDPNLPMRLAICTYHRQEDAPYIESLLGESFEIHYSNSYYWHMPDPMPPFLRHGVMRATKILM